jgi:amidase
MSGLDDLCFASARTLAAEISGGRLSAREVMTAHLAQIARVNPHVNAIVAKLPDEQCLALAGAADARRARGERLGPLHGLPIAFKDLQPAVGFPWTRGSTIFARTMPEEDSLLVERLRLAGAIPIGKTNVPEFGMGSHTYNRVYGITRNPYDLTKSAGGSSGGAGAALACGMLPIADGSDLGGSLRNPANFNNIVALRPTIGLVPTAPDPLPLLGLSVNGPMARSAQDVAYLLSAMAGADPRDPRCEPSDPRRFAADLGRDFAGVRVAWCPDLGGLPLDRGVRAVLDSRRATFEALGCVVEDAHPDLREADDIFLTTRRWRAWAVDPGLLDRHRKVLKPEAVDEIEAGARVTTTDLASALRRHGPFVERMRRFQERYTFMLCAVNQVPPFDADVPWPRAVEGVPMEHYVAWMRSAYWISTTGCPAASVPAGFTAGGLPVGIQIVGRARDDFAVLQLAHAVEQATGLGARRPAIAGGA